MNALLTALGSLAVVAFAASGLVAVVWGIGGRWLKRLAPAAESRILLALILLPIFAAVVSTLAYVEPPGGEQREPADRWQHSERELSERRGQGRAVAGSGERAHDDAEHNRPGNATDLADGVLLACLAVMGLVLVGRFVIVLGRAARSVRTAAAAGRSLRDAARFRPDGVYVLPSAKPEAFVLGLLRPVLYVSQGLLSLRGRTVEAVLAHERAHMERLDPLRHLVALLACTFHLPGVAGRLQRRFQQSNELAADAWAARSLGDSIGIAEALVACSRFRAATTGALRLAFGGGALEERVRTLLIGQRTVDQPRPWLIGAVATLIVITAARLAGSAHHAFEFLTR